MKGILGELGKGSGGEWIGSIYIIYMYETFKEQIKILSKETLN